MDVNSLGKLMSAVRGESTDGEQLVANPGDNPICCLTYDEKATCIAFVWRKYPTSMQFRFVHEIALRMLDEHKSGKILGDDRELPIIHAEDQRWVLEDWMPRARAVGLKAVAATASRSFFGKLSIGSVHAAASRDLAIRQFLHLAEAREWLGRVSLDERA